MRISITAILLLVVHLLVKSISVIGKNTHRHIDKKRLHEFPLTDLLNIAVLSNDANRFIKSNQLRGKPLEIQYEKTREQDLDLIEDNLIGRKHNSPSIIH